MHPALIAALLAMSCLPAYAAGELRSTLQDQQGVAVTIYNEDLALVKDRRTVRLVSGQGALAFRDVAARMRPETALLRSLSHPGRLVVVEQNFDFDLLTPQKLLEKFVGGTVAVIRTNPATGEETREEAQVLAASQGVVLQVGGRIETGLPGRIVYPHVPANLRDRPTLVMQLDNGGEAQQQVELSYLTGGLSWRADYVAELNAADDRLDLSGWVTLTNTSGTTYRDARLQLVAGDVHRVREELHPVRALAGMDVLTAEAPRMAEEALLEYHLYTLDRPTTIADNQTKQVALLAAAGVPVRKELLLRGAEHDYQSSVGELGRKMKVGVFIEFDNRETARLGLPLPGGIIRVYKQDGVGRAQFVGEDRIDHAPRNETVRLKLGESFDVTASRKQTDFRKLPPPAKGTVMYESAFEIVLKNARQEAVTVTVQEPIPADWKMLQESHPHTRAAGNVAEWKIRVPPDGQTTLGYRVQVKY